MAENPKQGAEKYRKGKMSRVVLNSVEFSAGFANISIHLIYGYQEE